MSKKTTHQIEAELNAQINDARASLSSTLEALAYQAQPSVQVEKAKQSFRNRVEEAKADAIETWEEAKEGDPEAVKKVLIAAAAGVAGVALLTYCALRQQKKYRHRRQWKAFTRELRHSVPPGFIEFSVREPEHPVATLVENGADI